MSGTLPCYILTMLEELLRKLNSRRKTTARAAQRALSALPPETLLQLVEMTARTQRKEWRRLLLLTASLYSSFTLWAWWISKADSVQFICMIAYAYTLFPILVHWVSTRNLCSTRTIEILSQRIALTDDPRIAATALQLAHDSQDFLVQRQLHLVIKRLLNRLSATDAGAWTKAQKAALLLPLRRPMRDPELTLCMLKALEQVGDEDALPAVQRLLAIHLWQPLDFLRRRKQIAAAAQACLPFLHSRAEENRLAQTLLRPSAREEVATQTLLRPLTGCREERPAKQTQTLLRPVVGPKDERPAEPLLRPDKSTEADISS